MIIKSKDDKEWFKREVGQAMINTSGRIAFVAMQENNSKTHNEYKKLNKYYDILDNLWDYVDFCIDNDLSIDISTYAYNLVRTLSENDVKDYKKHIVEIIGSIRILMNKKNHAVTDLIIKYLESGWDYQDLTDFIWLLYSSQVIDIDEVTLICNTFDRVFDCNNIKKNNNKAYFVKE